MKTFDPITSEAGNGQLFTGAVPDDPCDLAFSQPVLAARQEFLIAFAQGLLWNPADKTSSEKGVFAIGMECGQYGLDLPEMLTFGHKIGCQVIQPSANHIDLARAATDSAYRIWVWKKFQQAEMPLTSVSIHCDTYAALAILDNRRARMFTPPEFQGLDAEGACQAHLNKIKLMIIGAAQFGIPALHLFWGMPADLKPYGWQPQNSAEVMAMRVEFAKLVKPLVTFASRLGVSLCHEIHFGTVAMTADDLIEVWKMLGQPDNFCAGFDPSHFWHGEQWWTAMDKLRGAGMKVVLAHAKNFSLFPGRPMLGLQMDDRFRGMSFTSLDNPAGGVSMIDYLGFLTVSGLIDFWFGHGLPAPVHVEAENPFFKINGVTGLGVGYLRGLTTGLELPTGHFTDAMKREGAAKPAKNAAEPPAALAAALDVVAAAEPPASNGPKVQPKKDVARVRFAVKPAPTVEPVTELQAKEAAGLVILAGALKEAATVGEVRPADKPAPMSPAEQAAIADALDVVESITEPKPVPATETKAPGDEKEPAELAEEPPGRTAD